jgi:hypothetical protein
VGDYIHAFKWGHVKLKFIGKNRNALWVEVLEKTKCTDLVYN